MAIIPSADRLEAKIGNKYSLVIVAAKRARQLKEGAVPLVPIASENPLTISLDEVAAEQIVAISPPEPVPQEALTPAAAAASLLASLGGDETFFDEEETEAPAGTEAGETPIVGLLPIGDEAEEEAEEADSDDEETVE